jgi:hypothetical protein
MKKIFLFGIMILAAFSFYAANCNLIPTRNTASSNSMGIPNRISMQNEKRDSLPFIWKTYASNKLSCTFRYPSTWSQVGGEAETIDLKGNVTVVEISFVDSVTHSNLSIAYHLPPNGTKLYEYAVSNFNSSHGDKQIDVAGKKAILMQSIIKIDGKGHKLNSQLILIVVDLLDKNQTGEIEFQFKFPKSIGDEEVPKFNQLLSSFNFTN